MGAGGETAAASDPEGCKEAKYGQLPEQMLSLLGNHSKVSWKSQRTKRCRKALMMPDLQESLGHGQVAPIRVARWHIPSCSVITTLCGH